MLCLRENHQRRYMPAVTRNRNSLRKGSYLNETRKAVLILQVFGLALENLCNLSLVPKPQFGNLIL